MSFDAKTFYAVKCDFPDCGALDDGGEFTYWSDPDSALQNALDAEWHLEEGRGLDSERRVFCDAHSTRWRSDETPEPDGPDALLLDLPDGEAVELR